MPILDVTLVGDETPPPDLAQRLADAAGTALGAPPGRVWVRLHPMPAQHYAENGATQPDPLPVFVTLLHARPPEGSARTQELAQLTAAVAQAVGRPAERVHLEYAPAGAGRVGFGGVLVG